MGIFSTWRAQYTAAPLVLIPATIIPLLLTVELAGAQDGTGLGVTGRCRLRNTEVSAFGSAYFPSTIRTHTFTGKLYTYRSSSYLVDSETDSTVDSTQHPVTNFIYLENLSAPRIVGNGYKLELELQAGGGVVRRTIQCE